jgi:hypothetical protein
MTTMMPEGEPIRRAVAWIAEQRQAEPNINAQKLADEAVLKFDLSPTEAEFLWKFVSGKAGC